LAGFMSCVKLHNFIPHFFRTPLTMKFCRCPTCYDTHVSIESKNVPLQLNEFALK
jgi:hypothetical protein